MVLFDLQKTGGRSAVVRSSKQSPKICRADIAVSEAFPKIEHGMDYPYCSGGEWSTHDLIFFLLSKIGPSNLTAATWSVSEAATHKLIEKMEDGLITGTHFLVDWRVRVRTPAFLAVAKHRFSDVRVGNCHAKIFVLDNPGWTVSVVGSANFTNNPRIEAGHLSTNEVIGNFHKNWIISEINRAEPFGCDMNAIGKADGRK